MKYGENNSLSNIKNNNHKKPRLSNLTNSLKYYNENFNDEYNISKEDLKTDKHSNLNVKESLARSSMNKKELKYSLKEKSLLKNESNISNIIFSKKEKQELPDYNNIQNCFIMILSIVFTYFIIVMYFLSQEQSNYKSAINNFKDIHLLKCSFGEGSYYVSNKNRKYNDNDSDFRFKQEKVNKHSPSINPVFSIEAKGVLKSKNNNDEINGEIEISEVHKGISVIGKINGLEAGSSHGLHIIEFNIKDHLEKNTNYLLNEESELVSDSDVNESNYNSNSKSNVLNSKVKSNTIIHYNPTNEKHSCPVKNPKSKFHKGDLGNIIANNIGEATFSIVKEEKYLTDLNGRAIVITEKQDDCHSEHNKDSRILAMCSIMVVSPRIEINENKNIKINRSNVKKQNEKVVNEFEKKSVTKLIPTYNNISYNYNENNNIVKDDKLKTISIDAKKDILSNINSDGFGYNSSLNTNAYYNSNKSSKYNDSDMKTNHFSIKSNAGKGPLGKLHANIKNDESNNTSEIFDDKDRYKIEEEESINKSKESQDSTNNNISNTMKTPSYRKLNMNTEINKTPQINQFDKYDSKSNSIDLFKPSFNKRLSSFNNSNNDDSNLNLNSDNSKYNSYKANYNKEKDIEFIAKDKDAESNDGMSKDKSDKEKNSPTKKQPLSVSAINKSNISKFRNIEAQNRNSLFNNIQREQLNKNKNALKPSKPLKPIRRISPQPLINRANNDMRNKRYSIKDYDSIFKDPLDMSNKPKNLDSSFNFSPETVAFNDHFQPKTPYLNLNNIENKSIDDEQNKIDNKQFNKVMDMDSEEIDTRSNNKANNNDILNFPSTKTRDSFIFDKEILNNQKLEHLNPFLYKPNDRNIKINDFSNESFTDEVSKIKPKMYSSIKDIPSLTNNNFNSFDKLFSSNHYIHDFSNYKTISKSHRNNSKSLVDQSSPSNSPGHTKISNNNSFHSITNSNNKRNSILSDDRVDDNNDRFTVVKKSVVSVHPKPENLLKMKQRDISNFYHDSVHSNNPVENFLNKKEKYGIDSDVKEINNIDTSKKNFNMNNNISKSQDFKNLLPEKEIKENDIDSLYDEIKGINSGLSNSIFLNEDFNFEKEDSNIGNKANVDNTIKDKNESQIKEASSISNMDDFILNQNLDNEIKNKKFNSINKIIGNNENTRKSINPKTTQLAKDILLMPKDGLENKSNVKDNMKVKNDNKNKTKDKNNDDSNSIFNLIDEDYTDNDLDDFENDRFPISNTVSKLKKDLNNNFLSLNFKEKDNKFMDASNNKDNLNKIYLNQDSISNELDDKRSSLNRLISQNKSFNSNTKKQTKIDNQYTNPHLNELPQERAKSSHNVNLDKNIYDNLDNKIKEYNIIKNRKNSNEMRKPSEGAFKFNKSIEDSKNKFLVNKLFNKDDGKLIYKNMKKSIKQIDSISSDKVHKY